MTDTEARSVVHDALVEAVHATQLDPSLDPEGFADELFAVSSLASLLLTGASVEGLERHGRILGITGPHPKGTSSRWLARDGGTFIAANSLAALASVIRRRP